MAGTKILWAMNRSLREVCVGRAGSHPPTKRWLLGRTGPKSLAHWKASDAILVEILTEVPRGRVEAFLRAVVSATAPSYRVHLFSARRSRRAARR